MPRGRVAYKQYSLYCIGLQAVLATAYYTVPYKALLSIPPWAGAAFLQHHARFSTPLHHHASAQRSTTALAHRERVGGNGNAAASTNAGGGGGSGYTNGSVTIVSTSADNGLYKSFAQIELL